MTSTHLVVGGVSVASVTDLILSLVPNGLDKTQWGIAITLALAAGTGIARRVEQVGLRGFFAGVWRGQQPPAK